MVPDSLKDAMLNLWPALYESLANSDMVTITDIMILGKLGQFIDDVIHPESFIGGLLSSQASVDSQR